MFRLRTPLSTDQIWQELAARLQKTALPPGASLSPTEPVQAKVSRKTH